jgi:hypothetical protein
VSLGPRRYDFLLADGEGGGADFLVTGDKHGLLSMATFEGAQIVTARQMLTTLGELRRTAPKSSTPKKKRHNPMHPG